MLDGGRAAFHRLVLGAAACANLALGLWAGLAPHGFFRLFEMEPPRYPAIWSGLGMVVGCYGLAYAWASRRLDAARPIVAVGLLGKVLGPAAWCVAVASGEWPVRTFPLIVFHGLVWWLPFGLFLLDGTRAGARLRALAPVACAGLNALAALALAFALRPGTEATPRLAAREAYVAEHAWVWRGGWACWMAAATSLLAFFAWWGSRIPRRRVALLAFAIAAAGYACDLVAEALLMAWLPRDFEPVSRAATLLTGAAANGLYSVAGATLTLATPWFSAGLGRWAWGVWICGFALTAATLAASVPAIVVTTAALMLLFCPWALLAGRRIGAHAGSGA